MFDMNPLDTPNATLHHWVMLLVAGLLGFIIGYISRQQTIIALKKRLTYLTDAVDECQKYL